MEQYIPKAAVVAEINRIKNTEYNGIFIGDDIACCALDMAIDAINNLELKQVDLEKEIDDYVNEHFSECDDGVLISDANSKELTLLDITPLAKHFFELGLKTQKGE